MPKFDTVVEIGSALKADAPKVRVEGLNSHKCSHCGGDILNKFGIRYAGHEKIGYQVYHFERFCCGTVICNNAVSRMYRTWRDHWRAVRAAEEGDRK